VQICQLLDKKSDLEFPFSGNNLNAGLCINFDLDADLENVVIGISLESNNSSFNKDLDGLSVPFDLFVSIIMETLDGNLDVDGEFSSGAINFFLTCDGNDIDLLLDPDVDSDSFFFKFSFSTNVKFVNA